MTTTNPPSIPSSKVAPRHLERWALVYIRQSTPQQLTRHQESTRLQYALRERALGLGWEPERIEVIDDDLGQSGTSVEGRPGFQRLVAEVGLDHVGVILGLEMSRFARSCRDWHQLLEVCALFGTLIADLDGVYDPVNHNDRLLLGLKGTISEAELYLLKRRMLDGRMAKAQRGELGKGVPMGYCRRPSGEVVKDPDEQARTVVALVFELFERIRSVHGVLRYLHQHGIQMPVRETGGPRMGDLAWTRPVSTTLRCMIKNPIYAGAYAYGRRAMDKRLQKPGRPGTGFRVVPQERWKVFLPDRFPAYITLEQFRRNLDQMRANRSQLMGTPRPGRSLVAGLLFCGRCGRRMGTAYPGTRLEYLCNMASHTWQDPFCQTLAGGVLDEEIERQVLDALKPATLEVSMAVAADIEARRAKEEVLWRQRLERARYETERSQRQYNAVEPENRLVVRTLERDWEEKLQALRQLEEEYRRHQAKSPPCLTASEREAIQALAADIPGLWRAPTTTPAHRKEIVRQLIDRVVVEVVGTSERVRVQIIWAGGFETRTEIVRPVRKFEQLTYFKDLVERVRSLKEGGRTASEIAQCLNEENFRPAKRRTTFTTHMVRQLFYRWGMAHRRGANKKVLPEMASDEWTVEALSKELDLPITTLYAWIHRNWVQARRAPEKRCRWIIRADEAELARLRPLRNATSRERYEANRPNGRKEAPV